MTTHCHCLLILKHKKNKTHKKTTKNKTKKRERAYLQAPTLPFHFWFPLLPFYFKCFLLASFSSQTKEKKRKTKKKNHREEKKCKEGREFSFKLPLCPVTFNSRFCLHFYLFVSNAFCWYFPFLK